MKFRTIAAWAVATVLSLILMRVYQLRGLLFYAGTYEIGADVCISGPDAECNWVKPRTEPIPLSRSTIRTAEVKFELGGPAELRPSVHLEVATARVTLTQLDLSDPFRPRQYELASVLSRPQLEPLLAELFSPEFLEWAQGSGELYDSEVMDGDLLILQISGEDCTWKVTCSNHFPAPLRRFGCILSERVRRQVFQLDREKPFSAATYAIPNGVTLTEVKRP